MNFFQRFKTAWDFTKMELKAGVTDADVRNAMSNFLSPNVTTAIGDRPEDYINDGFMFNPTVFAVVTHIVGAASSVPPVLLRVTDEKKAREYFRYKYAQKNRSSEEFKRKSKQYRQKAFEEVADSPLLRLLDRPNPLQAWPEFIANNLGFKLTTGNSYVHGIPLSDRRIGEMWNLPSQFVRIRAGKSVESIIESYLLQLRGLESKPIPEEDIMHNKYWNPDYSTSGSHLYGMSPLRALRRTVKASNDGQTALSRSFQNMGASGMLFPDDPDIDQLNEAQRNSFQKFFDQKGSGPENYKSALVTNAKMGWTAFGMSPVDLEIIESDRNSDRKICNAYRFPSELLNDPETKTNANKKESRKQMWLDVVIPELEQFYSELNRWLTPRFGDNLFIDYDISGVDALAEDMKEKSEWLMKTWPIPPNRVLEELGFDPSDNPQMDEPWVPLNQLPLSLAAGDMSLSEEDEKLLRLEYVNGN